MDVIRASSCWPSILYGFQMIASDLLFSSSFFPLPFPAIALCTLSFDLPLPSFSFSPPICHAPLLRLLFLLSNPLLFNSPFSITPQSSNFIFSLMSQLPFQKKKNSSVLSVMTLDFYLLRHYFNAIAQHTARCPTACYKFPEKNSPHLALCVFHKKH